MQWKTNVKLKSFHPKFALAPNRSQLLTSIDEIDYNQLNRNLKIKIPIWCALQLNCFVLYFCKCLMC